MKTRSMAVLAATVLAATALLTGCFSAGPDAPGGEAVTITADGPAVSGTLSSETPENLFQFQATAGTCYYIETSQLVPAAAGDECDTQIALLRRPDETPITTDDDGGLEYLASAIYWKAPVSGIYYVNVGSYQDDSGEWSGLGTYSLSIKTTPPDFPAPVVLTVNGAGVAGSFDIPGEQDWYSFTVEAGQEYIIFTSELSPDCDTMVYLRDGQLLDLAFNDDVSEENLASAITFTAEYTGTCYVMVQTWGEHIGTYRIEVITE